MKTIIFVILATLLSSCGLPSERLVQHKKQWNAAKVNWQELNGKKISTVIVSEYGDSITLRFEDGSHIQIESYKYPMHVN